MLVAAFCMLSTTPAMAQFNLGKAVGGAAKAVKAATLTDADVANYVKEYINWMDQHNQVCADNNPYAIRLKKLTEGLTNVEGIPLNFKVYYVTDVNAFACADGSVSVFSSHPDLDKRIKTMSERAKKDGFERPENKMPEKPAVKVVAKGKKK